jgi:hypothetical protein
MRRPFLITVMYCICLICSSDVFSQPVISSFYPTAGPAGTLVQISGKNIGTATAVSFGGSPAASFHIYTYIDSVTHILDTGISATVGTGATGLVAVTTPQGTASLGTFTLTIPPQAPVIYSFTPTSAGTGTTISIKGKYFSEANYLSFGTVSAASF